MMDNNITLVTFRLRPSAVDDPFHVEENQEETNRYLSFVDWSTAANKSSEELTVMLQNEIVNYTLNNNLLQSLCEDNEDYYTITIDEHGDEYSTSFTPEDTTCDNHLSAVFQRSISDVLSRDSDAFHPKIGVDLYVVVLLYNDAYYGHIYTWKYNNLCVAIGIRAKIDLLFLRDSYTNVPRDISGYLFEGVRRFALVMGCTKIVVPYPLDNMARILKAKGFVVECMRHSELGEGPGIMDPRSYRFIDRQCTKSNTIKVSADTHFASIDKYILVE